MKLFKFIIFLSFCFNVYSAHAGITGTPTPKSAKTVDADSQKNKDATNKKDKTKSDDKH
jgi:hypothetical protein